MEIERLQQRIQELEAENQKLQNELVMHRQTMLEMQTAKQQAEDASNAKSSFLTNISHDIRAPLNTIIGLLQIVLKRSKQQQVPPEILNPLENIHLNVQNLNILVSDIDHSLESYDRSCRILVVEDNFMNQAAIAALVEGMGLSVELASNGREGVEKALQTSPDLILMDVSMPVMDGLDAAQQIHSRSEYKDLPIIALTAGAFSTRHEQKIKSTFSDYITKPIDQNKLLSLLRKHLPKLLLLENISSPSPSTIIDQAFLQGIEPVLCQELMEMFVQQFSPALEKLKELIQNQQQDKIAELAHRLKGSCATIGASQMENICAQIKGNIDSLPQMEKWLQELERSYQRTKAKMSSFLKTASF